MRSFLFATACLAVGCTATFADEHQLHEYSCKTLAEGAASYPEFATRFVVSGDFNITKMTFLAYEAPDKHTGGGQHEIEFPFGIFASCLEMLENRAPGVSWSDRLG